MSPKPYKLIVPQAIRDQLDDIFAYTQTHQSKRRAEKIEDSLISAMVALPANPYIHPIERGVEHPSERVRRVIVGKTYRIVYDIDGDEVIILAVLHCARNSNILKTLR